jgi:hypothetical protein
MEAVLETVGSALVPAAAHPLPEQESGMFSWS